VNAKALWATSLSYCSGYLTDGNVSRIDHLPTVAVETFGLVPSALKKATAAADELADRGLWKRTAKGWVFNDWKDNNPSASSVRKKRTQDKRRDWLHKSLEGQALKRLVRARDGDICSWCDEPVRWGSNRAPDGGTYDHIDPNGPDVAENLVIAHNSCNGRKADRDHDELGWSLRPGHALKDHSEIDPDSIRATESDSIRFVQSSEMRKAGTGRVGSDSIGADRFGSLPVRYLESVPHPTDVNYTESETA
jgi:5-methylcytosine-specific restriction endonuclease McrA